MSISRSGNSQTLRAGVVGGILLLLAGCELQQTDPIQPEDVLVAEARLILAEQFTGEARLEVAVLLHRSLGLSDPGPVNGAVVSITGDRGGQVFLVEGARDDCFVFEGEDPVEAIDEDSVPRGNAGCYQSPRSPSIVSPFRAGEVVTLSVELPNGDVLTARSQIPGAYSMTGLQASASLCRIDPSTTIELGWEPSENAWAYLNETTIRGLPEALAGQGVSAPEDLYLTGLSVSQSDVSIVFPSEFGLFERFDLDRDLAAVLQRGLPEGAGAEIAISALDRNWVNWARGANFNPTGAVRVPSVSGDGTGVFGTAVRHKFVVVSAAFLDDETPACVEAL